MKGRWYECERFIRRPAHRDAINGAQIENLAQLPSLNTNSGKEPQWREKRIVSLLRLGVFTLGYTQLRPLLTKPQLVRLENPHRTPLPGNETAKFAICF